MRFVTYVIFIILAITFILCITSNEAMSQNNINYEIGTECEVPTLIQYGNIIPGLFSNTLYLGISKNREDSSSHVFMLTFNTMIYELANVRTEFGSSRDWSTAGFGWTPANLYSCGYVLTGHKLENSIVIFSPGLGYSYSFKIYQFFEISLGINFGISYGCVDKPELKISEDEAVDNYNNRLRGYEKMNGVNNHYGFRNNEKIKISFITNSIRLGISIGYSHYVFSQNNFNSYDIGTFYSIVF